MIVCVICTYPNRNILCQMNVIIINEIYMLSMQKICLYTLGRLNFFLVKFNQNLPKKILNMKSYN